MVAEPQVAVVDMERNRYSGGRSRKLAIGGHRGGLVG